MKTILKIIFPITLLLITFTGCGKRGQANVNILYTTDAHGNVVTDEDVIGLDTIATLKKNTENPVLVDAGDFLHGTPLVEKTQGEDVVTWMKEAGYMVATVGEADFSYGLDVMKARVNQAKEGKYSMHLLSSNIRAKDGSEIFDPYSIIQVDGIKIGFIGLSIAQLDPQAYQNASEELQFLDVAAQASKAVGELKKQGCGIIVALSHLGNQREDELNSLEIAKQVEGIDFIIDGHTHRTMEASVGGTQVVSSGSGGAYVGQLAIQYDRSKKQIMESKNTLIGKKDVLDVEPDEDIARGMANAG